MAGSTKVARKNKGENKVDFSMLALLAKVLFKLTAIVSKGLIEGECSDKELFSK